jgi:peptidyl-prolyl cis-trans isomerase A (cyclophilin A)
MFGRSRELFTPPPIDVPGEGALYARFSTSMGEILVRLFEKESPLTVANFVYLVNKGHYTNLIFHRVIPNFMIQGGCPDGVGTGGPGYVIKDEFHPSLRHDRPGILSMANAGPNTGGSQFFITEVPTPWLDNRHAIFGEVVKGVELIPQITGVKRDPRDRPLTPIVLKSVELSRA